MYDGPAIKLTATHVALLMTLLTASISKMVRPLCCQVRRHSDGSGDYTVYMYTCIKNTILRPKLKNSTGKLINVFLLREDYLHACIFNLSTISLTYFAVLKFHPQKMNQLFWI